jgi:hypothetical protein
MKDGGVQASHRLFPRIGARATGVPEVGGAAEAVADDRAPGGNGVFRRAHLTAATPPAAPLEFERRGLGIERSATITAPGVSRSRRVSDRGDGEFAHPASTTALQLLSECDSRALAGAVGESAGRRVGSCCRRHHVAGTKPRRAAPVVAPAKITVQRSGLQKRGDPQPSAGTNPVSDGSTLAHRPRQRRSAEKKRRRNDAAACAAVSTLRSRGRRKRRGMLSTRTTLPGRYCRPVTARPCWRRRSFRGACAWRHPHSSTTW